jgi:sulfur-oxidizing protein SoxY
MNARRRILGSLVVLVACPWGSAAATSSDAMRIVEGLVAGRPIRVGDLHIELAPLVENGNSVSVRFRVTSPMTESDHVRALHVVSEGNPLPQVIRVQFTPLSGRAEFTTRIRLAQSQRIWAVAECSDGSVLRASAETVVTLSACTDMI